MKNGFTIKNFHFKRKFETISSIPDLHGEIIIVFQSFTKSFFYDERGTKIVPLDFSSTPFKTTTLSDTASIDDPEQDVNRLKLFLKEFDKEVETKRSELFSQHGGKIYTSNPECWNL